MHPPQANQSLLFGHLFFVESLVQAQQPVGCQVQGTAIVQAIEAVLNNGPKF